MHKRNQRELRHRRVRGKVTGTPARPRMNIFRSTTHIYVQLIDDDSGKTLAAASSQEVKTKGTKKVLAAEVGKLAVKRAIAAGIKQVVFDRGGYQYHGRVKELAESARSAGLEF